MFTLDPNNADFLTTLDFLVKIIGGFGGIILFIVGLKRYVKGQTWKKNEFIANEFKDFNNDKMVINTMFMLDWGKRYIELFPTKPEYKERFARVTRSTLKSALQSHRIKDTFTKVEVAIRDNFDTFLNYFEKYYQFIEARLITKKELEPYLKYWIKTISDDIEPDVKNTLHHYINEYGYEGVQELFKTFGKDIVPKTPIESSKFVAEEQTENDSFEDASVD